MLHKKRKIEELYDKRVTAYPIVLQELREGKGVATGVKEKEAGESHMGDRTPIFPGKHLC